MRVHLPRKIPWAFLWLILLGCFRWDAARAATLEGTVIAENANAGHVLVRWRTDNPTRGRVLFGQRTDAMTNRITGPIEREHALDLGVFPPATTVWFAVGTARELLCTNTFTTGSPGGQLTRSLPSPVLDSKRNASPNPSAPSLRASTSNPPPTRETWGHLESLPDHFARHGADFGAKSADDYARLAWLFLQEGRRRGFPAKMEGGVFRVFDAKTGTFAAYNRDGTTKTFFKPNSASYFERQPGEAIDLKNWRPK